MSVSYTHLFAEVEKVAALKPDILAHIDLIKKLNANGEFFDEESPRYICLYRLVQPV